MKRKSLTKLLCRAGVIAALYVALTYIFMPFAYGPFQIRPAEAFCILPLFFPEAVPALYIGCMISNLPTGSIPDIILGSLATLISAFGTYMVGRFLKNAWLKIILGGIFPILFNAFIIPLIIVFLNNEFAGYPSTAIAYFSFVASIALTETVWVYALGAPLYFSLEKLRKKALICFLQ